MDSRATLINSVVPKRSMVDGVQMLHVTVYTGEGDSIDRGKAIAIARDLSGVL